MLVRANFGDLYLTSMLPAIDELIFQRYDRYPDNYTKIFRVMDSSRSIEQTTEVTGFGTFVQVGEGGRVSYDDPRQGFDKTYLHGQYALGFRITKVAIDDDKYGFIQKLGSELGRSAKETIEIIAAAIFNNGFDSAYPGPDGKALFATDHPLVGGGVQSNTLAVAADLDIPTLELMLTDFRKLVDHRGKKMRIVPTRLIIPPDLEWVAAELLGGTMRADTTNNTINAFRNRVGLSSFRDIQVWEYLTDPDAFFIAADKEDTELRFYWREKPNTIHDLDFDTRSIKTAMWFRMSAGWSGYLGVSGSPGA
jgi:phage major head subunit gpT-like protein